MGDWDGTWRAPWATGVHPDPEGDDGPDPQGPGPGPQAAEAPGGRPGEAGGPPHDPDDAPLLDALLSVVDAASEQLGGRPIRPRVKLTPAGLLRGELDVVRLELPAVLAAGLVLDRVAFRAERVRITPGLPPRLRAGPVHATAVVSQANVDRWTKASRLPIKLRLDPGGISVTTGIGGLRVGELQTRLGVTGRFLRLEPTRARVAGLPAPLLRFLRGYLPLPPLPRGARLVEVDHSEGELAARFGLEDLDEPLTPALARRIGRTLRLPLPGL